MDGNKDEAERCAEIAERLVREKRFQEAEKFARKSLKLYPSRKAEDLLITLKQSQNSESEAESRRDATETDGPDTIQYTEEQTEHVKRIQKCTDYYEMLGVTKDATDGDIKKAYKKLALQLHPDKNKVPGAAEAFKAIGNAVAVLIDVDKRRQYDLNDSDEDKLNFSTNLNYTYPADIVLDEHFIQLVEAMSRAEFLKKLEKEEDEGTWKRWMRQAKASLRNKFR